VVSVRSAKTSFERCTQRVADDADFSDAVKRFLSIGKARNTLVHSDFVSLPLKETLDELIASYRRATLFVNVMSELLLDTSEFEASATEAGFGLLTFRTTPDDSIAQGRREAELSTRSLRYTPLSRGVRVARWHREIRPARQNLLELPVRASFTPRNYVLDRANYAELRNLASCRPPPLPPPLLRRTWAHLCDA